MKWSDRFPVVVKTPAWVSKMVSEKYDYFPCGLDTVCK